MTKKIIQFDKDELLNERETLLKRIEQIDAILSYCPRKVENKQVIKQNTDTFGGTRTQRATALCEEYLRDGNKVSKVGEFIELIRKNGVNLTRSGLLIALKKAEPEIVYDHQKKQWVFKED